MVHDSNPYAAMERKFIYSNYITLIFFNGISLCKIAFFFTSFFFFSNHLLCICSIMSHKQEGVLEVFSVPPKFVSKSYSIEPDFQSLSGKFWTVSGVCFGALHLQVAKSVRPFQWTCTLSLQSTFLSLKILIWTFLPILLTLSCKQWLDFGLGWYRKENV